MRFLPERPGIVQPRGQLPVATGSPGWNDSAPRPLASIRKIPSNLQQTIGTMTLLPNAPSPTHPRRLTIGLPGLLLAACAAGVPAADAVQAQLSAQELAFGQPVELTLTAQGEAPAGPDLAVLEQDFRILDRRVERRLAISNGHGNAQVRLTLLLLPRREGTLQVPAIPMGDARTQPLTLTVRPDTGQPTEPRAFAPPPFAPLAPLPMQFAPSGPPPTPGVDPWNTPWTDRTPPSAPTAGGASGGSNTWFWISLGLAAALAAVLFTRRAMPIAPPPVMTPSPPAPVAPVDQARAQIHAAYQAGDAAAARSAWLEWAAVRWPAAPPGNLAQLALRCPPPLRGAINRLEMAFFSPAPIAWAQEPVAAGLEALERDASAQPTDGKPASAMATSDSA